MRECSLIIDGGTTNTRFTLLDGDAVIERKERRVGASDSEAEEGNLCLMKSVSEAVREMEKKHGCQIRHIYASGMITSDAGLYEVSHMEAPVSLGDLAKGMVTTKISGIGEDIAFHFVPGVKFFNEDGVCTDMMRGEETEVFGALKPEDYDKSVIMVHFGSHNKMIACYNGKICEAITTIGGELLWAALHHTILKTSVGTGEDDFQIMEKYVRMGYEEARCDSITRALFSARIHSVIRQASADEVKSFIYGALMYSDLKAFAPLMKQKADKFIFYGREYYIEAFKICMKLMYPDYQVRMETIPFEKSEWLSLKGIRMIQAIGMKESGMQRMEEAI